MVGLIVIFTLCGQPVWGRDAAVSDLYSRVVKLYDSGDYPAAKKMGLEVLHIAQAFHRGNHPDIGLCLNNLAGIEKAMGHYETSQALYKRALKIYCKHYGSGHIEVATVMNNLGVLYLKMGWISRSERLLFRSSWIIGATVDAIHPVYHKSLGNIAELYRARGLTAKAMELHERARVLRKYFTGSESPETMESLSDIGDTYRNAREFVKAIEDQSTALRVRKRILGLNHPDTATSHQRLSMVYRQKQYYDAALAEALEALRIRELKLGPDHPETADTLYNLALIRRETGFVEESEELIQRALQIRKRKLRPHHPDILLAQDTLIIIRKERSENAFKPASLKPSMGEVSPQTLSPADGRAVDSVGKPIATQKNAGPRTPIAKNPLGNFQSSNHGSAANSMGLSVDPSAQEKQLSSIVVEKSEGLESLKSLNSTGDSAEKPNWFQKISSWMNLSDVDRVTVQSDGPQSKRSRSGPVANQDPMETIREMEKQAADYRAKGMLEEAEMTTRLLRKLKAHSVQTPQN